MHKLRLTNDKGFIMSERLHISTHPSKQNYKIDSLSDDFYNHLIDQKFNSYIKD